MAGDDDSRDKIIAAGAIPPLVALLGTQSPATVLDVAVKALHNLVSNADNQMKVADAGAIHALVDGGAIGSAGPNKR